MSREGKFINEISRWYSWRWVGAMEQLAGGVIVLPEPPPKPDEFSFRLAEFVERDDLLLMREGQVVRDEVIKEEGDLLNIRWHILHAFFLQLLEVIGKLLNHRIPLLSLPRPPPALLGQVQPNHFLKPGKELPFLFLILFGGGLCLLTGFWSDEVGDDSFLFLLLYGAICGGALGGELDFVFVSGV